MGAEVHCYNGGHELSLFTSVLMHLKTSLVKNLSKEWMGNPPQKGHVIEVENPADFARFFSSMLFVFCQEGNEDEIDDIEAFGVGYLWGGCAILHVLGLFRHFLMLDFSYHVLKLNLLGPLERHDPNDKKKKRILHLQIIQRLLPSWIKPTGLNITTKK